MHMPEEIVQELQGEAFLRALQRNFGEEMATFGRYLPHGRVHEDPEIKWYMTGIAKSMFNGVLDTCWSEEDVDEKIEAIIQLFHQQHLPMSWAIGPATRPVDLGTHLLRHGFRHIHEADGMAADLLSLPENEVIPEGFHIERVRTPDLLKLYFQASQAGFGSLSEEIQPYHDAYTAMGFDEQLPWRHYVGLLHNEPVAASSLIMYARVAGIYGVATVPEARRQGIGAAMTLAPLREARARGYRVGVLSPSAMGRNMYRSLGFQECCTIHIYRLETGKRKPQSS